MKAHVETISSVKQAINVEVPEKLIQSSRKKTLQRLAKEVRIPGFRKGKVPTAMLEKKLGAEMDQELVKQIVQDTYPEAVKEAKVQPLSEPRIEPGMYEKGKPFSYRALFDVFPEIKVEDYKGIKLEAEECKASEEDLENELTVLQRQMTQLEPLEEGELSGETMALIDFKGTADGESFKGSEAKDFVVECGTGQLLAVFEDQIKGMKVGETRTIHFDYPEDYFNFDVAGKKGEFEVKLKELRKKIVPELNDDLAKSLGDYKNFAAFKADLEKRIAEAKSEMDRRQLHRKIIEHLCEKNKIEVPEVMLHTELSSMLEQHKRELESKGQSFDTAHFDVQQFITGNHDEAMLRTRAFLLVNAIGKQEDIKVEAAEIEARIELMAKQAGKPLQEVKAFLQQQGSLGRVESELFLEKALDFVLNEAKIKRVAQKNEKNTKKPSKVKKTK
ncbi:MAG: trigger factor [Deltaproteobacteria bacterium CG_4_9_14_0_2_um_filter_42_21]|nr:MAG: trigger factor [Deltaproteobacteria bacterium CG_4_9_14_0_2_um_filter_42_21]